MSSRTLIEEFCHDQNLTDQEYIDVVSRLAALNFLKAPRDKPYHEIVQWAEDYWVLLGKTLKERSQAREAWIQYENALGENATPSEWSTEAKSNEYLKIVRLCGHRISLKEFIEIGKRAASILNITYHRFEMTPYCIFEWFQMHWNEIAQIIPQLNLPYKFEHEIERHGIDFLGSTYPNVRRHFFNPE